MEDPLSALAGQEGRRSMVEGLVMVMALFPLLALGVLLILCAADVELLKSGPFLSALVALIIADCFLIYLWVVSNPFW